MRVFCINSDGWIEKKKNLFGFGWARWVDCDGPTYGDTCNVVGSYWDEGLLYYLLLEWPAQHTEDGFLADEFIPLSEIDELELVNEKQLVNQ